MKTAEKTRTLGICPVFSRIPPDQMGILAEMMREEQLAAGEVLFKEGETADRIYVVAAGSLSVLAPGRSEPVRSLNPGAFFGEYGMFVRFARTATVRAKTPAVLLSLDYARFRSFLIEFPESALVLLTTAVERLAALERAIPKE